MNYKIRKIILQTFENFCFYPKTELVYSTDFELLIAVILSAQSTDIQVNKVTKKLFYIAPTPNKILLLGIEKLELLICSIGLFRKKSLYIIKTCNILISKYNGVIPNKKSNLLSLPGVGSKTANIILNTLFHYDVIAVDRHVFRVCNRIGFVVGKTINLVEKKLINAVPKYFKSRFHNWFVLHGRYICIAKNPKCNVCIVNTWCNFYHTIFLKNNI